jgi:hypothetical protein
LCGLFAQSSFTSQSFGNAWLYIGRLSHVATIIEIGLIKISCNQSCIDHRAHFTPAAD